MPVLIADKPEHRAKVASLAASIQQAADILAGLNTAVDPAEYLMQIRYDFTRPERLAKEVQLLHNLAPGRGVDRAIENVARNRGKSVALVRQAVTDLFPVPAAATAPVPEDDDDL